MKTSQFILSLLTGALGLALGLALGPNAPADAKVSELGTRPFNHASNSDAGSIGPEAATKNAIRTRARVREEVPKSSVQRISIPLQKVAEFLQRKVFNNDSNFNNLHRSMPNALVLLGATETEQDAVMKLIEASKQEILAAEKIHLKLGAVTADSITIDMSGMRGPVEEIAARTKDGIKASLPADIAKGLLSAINWETYYPTGEKSFTRLEITRNASNTRFNLTAWEKQGTGGRGQGFGEFKDDGTPLPAEEIFNERWKSFLKGVTLLPKDY